MLCCLSAYPFDTQVNCMKTIEEKNIFVFFQTCSIDLAMGSLDNTTVTLLPDQLIMSQPVDMAIFVITDWNLKTDTLGKGNKGIKMKLVMKRKIVSEMMTTYFPTTLLVLITAATTQSWKKSETLGNRFPILVEFFF